MQLKIIKLYLNYDHNVYFFMIKISPAKHALAQNDFRITNGIIHILGYAHNTYVDYYDMIGCNSPGIYSKMCLNVHVLSI